MSDEPLPLLNVFEVNADDGRTRHLLAFIEPHQADSAGLDPRCIVGEVTPTDYGGYDPASLDLNPLFVESIVAYMNEVVASTADIIEQARSLPSGWVYIVDPRNERPPEAEIEPRPGDVVGAFGVNDSGQVIPNSFQYNNSHALIEPARGMSGLFSDQRFYDWLHLVKP